MRERLDSHKLIEEFMVLANVAAAQALEQRHAPCLYRVHDQPDPAKLEALREFLAHARHLRCRSASACARPTSTACCRRSPASRWRGWSTRPILRSQSQAVYSPQQSRPLRAGAAALRPLHLADPPLSRPDRPSRADLGLWAGRRRPARGRQGPLRGVRRASVDVRAPRRRGRAQRHGPLRRGLHGRPCRRDLRRPGHLGDALRPVRLARRYGRRRADPDPQPRPGVLPPRRRPPDAGRRAHRRDLRAGRPPEGASWTRPTRRPAACCSTWSR